jgi:hypothetical protein
MTHDDAFLPKLVPATEPWRLRDGQLVQEIAPQNRTTALRFRAGPPGALPFYRARQGRPSPRPWPLCTLVTLGS